MNQPGFAQPPSAEPLIDLGITPDMTRGTIDRQQQFGELAISLVDFDSFEARFAAIEVSTEAEKS